MKELELKERIRKLIGEDKLDAAIDILSKNVRDNENLDDLILQQARYNYIKKEVSNGTVSIDVANKELNELRKNLLAFLRTEELVVQVKIETIEPKIETFKDLFAMSLTRIKVAETLIFSCKHDEAIPISKIIATSQLKSRKLVFDFLNELIKFKLLEKRKEGASALWILNKDGKEYLENIIHTAKK